MSTDCVPRATTALETPGTTSAPAAVTTVPTGRIDAERAGPSLSSTNRLTNACSRNVNTDTPV